MEHMHHFSATIHLATVGVQQAKAVKSLGPDASPPNPVWTVMPRLSALSQLTKLDWRSQAPAPMFPNAKKMDLMPHSNALAPLGFVGVLKPNLELRLRALVAVPRSSA